MEDKYELDERAAIREIEGNLPKEAADNAARKDIDRRKMHRQLVKTREERDRIGTLFRAEKEQELKDNYFKKWMKANSDIIALERKLKQWL